MVVAWEWKDDDGNWIPYAKVDGDMLEKVYQRKAPTLDTTDLSFNAGYDTKYTFDFKAMTQLNNDSSRVRKLRRIDLGYSDDGVGGDMAFASGSSTTATATATAAPATASAVASAWASGDDDAPKKVAKTEPPPPAKKTPHAKAPPDVSAATVAAQAALGAQSHRNQKPLSMADPHGRYCFERMLNREKQLCGEWSVFYHSYSFAALLYEVQSAVAAVLFRFKSEYTTLPRLLKDPYNAIPDAEALLKEFPKYKDRDHNPAFRAVAICGTSSLLAPDSEAPPATVFLGGYSCADLSFVGVLEKLLVSCGVPDKSKKTMAADIIALSRKHGLDVSQFGSKACKSGRAGHMLQIFIKRSLVNKYVYGAFPFGVPDKKRKDLEHYLEGPGPLSGQVRIVTNPSVFMRGNAVRMYVSSADPTFHANRPAFQKELTALLQPVIGTADVRVKAAQGIYAGVLPSWFNAEDYEEQKKAKAAADGS